MPKGQAIKYTPEQLDFIKSNCSLSRISLTTEVNLKFKTDFSVDQIKSLCTRKKWNTGRTGCFPKGVKPWNTGTKGKTSANSTSFKKGDTPWNNKPIGYERIDSKDGYTLVKIAEPNKFALKHHIVYEKHYGHIPKGHCIRFKDGNRLNFEPENLIAIPLAANAILNKKYKHSEAHSEVKETLILMSLLDVKITELSA